MLAILEQELRECGTGNWMYSFDRFKTVPFTELDQIWS